ITYVARDTREPSPFAYELLNANPYAFLDGGEIQERRARAVATRQSLNVESLRDLGRLDPQAIANVIAEAQPEIRDADELHDLLLTRLLLPVWDDCTALPGCCLEEGRFQSFLSELTQTGRGCRVEYRPGMFAWVATENLAQAHTLFPEIPFENVGPATELDPTESLLSLLRGWLETSGPATAVELADLLALPIDRIFACLEAIEGEGLVLRGRFYHCDSEIESDSPEIEWCHRRLLARIHRRTMQGLRQEIEAVSPAVFMQYLFQHHGLAPGHRKQGADGLHETISQLQGIDIPAGAWETQILPGRVEGYSPSWLDELCLSGEVCWGRLSPPERNANSGRPLAAMTRAIPVSLMLREDLPWLTTGSKERTREQLSAVAIDIVDLLERQTALFANELRERLQLLSAELDGYLGELVAAGWISADGFAGLRQLIRADDRPVNREIPSRYRRQRKSHTGMGRWTLFRFPEATDQDASTLNPHPSTLAEDWCWQLIRRWGVVFRDLVVREPISPPWWQLAKMYRRLEARGEIRGGRFIRGVSGEQFGTSEAVRELRQIRQQEGPQSLIILSGADPLNLTGVIGSGNRVPALTGNAIAYLEGEIVGWKKGDQSWIAPDLPKQIGNRLCFEWGASPPPTSEGTSKPELVTELSADEIPAKKRRRKPKRSGVPKPFPF
ncbi:MAG: DEAD/DEAH box helicase, partial [Planctomycetaceae bacterium]|nr:DEAD/DEAH box helicase [Planctomycetaceae bacterium]